MLLLNPRQVRFGTILLDAITAIVIDRSPHRSVEEWSDLGPYATLADVPEQKVRIRLTQELARDDTAALRPGEQATLSFYTAPNSTDAGRKKLAATAAILSVEHELSPKRGALRTITLAAISDGSTDPITITDASNGEV
jgi:hypothetical protein